MADYGKRRKIVKGLEKLVDSLISCSVSSPSGEDYITYDPQPYDNSVYDMIFIKDDNTNPITREHLLDDGYPDVVLSLLITLIIEKFKVALDHKMSRRMQIVSIVYILDAIDTKRGEIASQPPTPSHTPNSHPPTAFLIHLTLVYFLKKE